MSFGDLERAGSSSGGSRNGNGASSPYSQNIAPPFASISQSSGQDMDANRAYLKLWDRASHHVFMISNNVASAEKLVNQLGTARDTPDLRHKLNHLMEDTREMIKQTSVDVKSVMSIDGHGNRQRKIAHQKLQKDFETVLRRFQAVSKQSAEKSRQYVAMARAQAAGHDDDDNDENQPLMGARLQQLQAVDNEIEFNESLIAEREGELVEIERSIAEVNEIFRDLGTLVNEQQYMLDNIETNIDHVAINMENATGELRQAARHQRNARNRMCFLMAMLAIVITVILLIVLL
ncbi:t-SNARE [Cladochytrium replicatum]|nr:t-SNARE [Cladochytrium replicatum]